MSGNFSCSFISTIHQYGVLRLLSHPVVSIVLTQQVDSAKQTKTRQRASIQALTDISPSVLCCHSNETRTSIANSPNSVQIEGTLYHSPKLHPGPCSSVRMRRATDRQTAVTNIHFASATPRAKCNTKHWRSSLEVAPTTLATFSFRDRRT